MMDFSGNGLSLLEDVFNRQLGSIPMKIIRCLSSKSICALVRASPIVHDYFGGSYSAYQNGGFLQLWCDLPLHSMPMEKIVFPLMSWLNLHIGQSEIHCLINHLKMCQGSPGLSSDNLLEEATRGRVKGALHRYMAHGEEGWYDDDPAVKISTYYNQQLEFQHIGEQLRYEDFGAMFKLMPCLFVCSNSPVSYGDYSQCHVLPAGLPSVSLNQVGRHARNCGCLTPGVLDGGCKYLPIVPFLLLHHFFHIHLPIVFNKHGFPNLALCSMGARCSLIPALQLFSLVADTAFLDLIDTHLLPKLEWDPQYSSLYPNEIRSN